MYEGSGATDTLASMTGVELAGIWFTIARAMAVGASAETGPDGKLLAQVPEAARHSGAGLYAQAVLGLTEEDCAQAKISQETGHQTLTHSLLAVRALPPDAAEKFMTGAMMIAFAERKLAPLAVRWATSLASAMNMTQEQFESCCLSGRILADMMNPPRKSA